MKGINERLNLIECNEEEVEEMMQACIEVARSTIRENRNALERLANEISKRLKLGKGVARIDGQKVTEILMKDANPF